MKLFYAFAICVLLIPTSVLSQKIEKTAGVKIGSINGLIFQKYYSPNQAYALTLGFHNDGIQIYALNQWYKRAPFNIPEEFYFYCGVGGHAGYSRYERDEYYYYDTSGEIIYDYRKKSYYAIGLDAIGGFEYRIYEIPMVVDIELQPQLDFYGMRYVYVDFFNIQVSLKYIF